MKIMIKIRAAAKCTEVTPQCPVEGTIYGYAPDLVFSIEFCSIFGVCSLIQLGQLIRYRLWSFSIAVVLGALTEVIGYFGRILLNKNPYSSAGFKTQICTLTLAPAFWSAAIYLTLKHGVNVLGQEYSTLRAKWYPYIFVTCDVISLILQGAGGGLAAAAAKTSKTSDIGSDVMMAGIVWQVVTLTVFAVMSGHFLLCIKNAPKDGLTVEARKVWNSRNFWIFFWGIFVAFVTTYVRCVYRIAEMAGGWKNPIMQDELDFTILESM
ncbi:Sphingoid long-chain base transporter [Penicillium chrysogenum]|uniref:Sphingoid long-chain base transporter n=1 Tax=Penicillium chrysogenum TaxID=5076 RepID=A0A167Q1B3_PENCH|nr:Sphingoid long-chain base transporter [Penicillium chrysogenum]